jgi:hypothetical protein
MTKSIDRDLGTYKEREYFLRIRATPDFNDPEDFAVVVYYNDASRRTREVIARVDTAHGYTHFDRLYRRDEPKDPVDWGIWEAADTLGSNWRQYAESHDQP